MNFNIKLFLKKSNFFIFVISYYRRVLFFSQKRILLNKFNSLKYPTLKSENKEFNRKSLKTLNVLWIGANENQDSVGFLDELSSIVNLIVFKNHFGFNKIYFDPYNVDKSRILTKDRLLFYLQNQDIDLIIGQFWPGLIDFSDNKLQEIIKSKSVKSICIAMDDYMPNRWIMDNYSKFAGPAGFGNSIDLYATSDLYSISTYSKLGLKSIYLPFGCSLSLNKGLNRDIDISFIGSNYGLRKNIIDSLHKVGINVDVYGPGFEYGEISSNEIISIYNRSKIVLGISQVGYQVHQKNLKTRDFDVISSGALYISNSCEELNAFFSPGCHYVKYDDINDLINKIRFYLKNDESRNNIALAGQKHGLENHLWRKYLERAIKMVYNE